jgi:predicted DNA-binding protein (MmcQ/YjbR family)
VSKKPAEDPRLARLTRICLALPEATRERHGDHAIFRARKKVFAYYLDNHHGDGIVALNCKVGPGDNTALIQAQPERFYMPAYIGPRGWVGFRLDVGEIDWEEVKELVTDSYRRGTGFQPVTATPRKRASPVR